MKADIYNITGEKTGQTDLPKAVFGADVNGALLAQETRVYLSNQRQALAKTKTRGEVDRTKAKWFRQKGTGRARHGSRSAPLFVGGGVAHGPRGNQNWKRRLPKQMRKKALAAALTVKQSEQAVAVVEDLETIKGKTKGIASLLKQLAVKDRATLILVKKIDNVSRAGRNITNLRICQIDGLNAYEVLNGGKILLSKEAVKSLNK